MAVATFTKTGGKAASAATLSKTIFAETVKSHELLQVTLVAQHAAQRANSAKTLKKGEVRGGGRKPWRQKGTGRARHGSIRSPLWRGGGITFGPSTDRNYRKHLTVASKRKALRQALTLAAQSGNLSVIEDFTAETGKTKPAASLLMKLALPRPLLLVVDKRTDELDRATRNIADLHLVTARYMSVLRIAQAKHVLLTKPAVGELEKWLNPKTVPESKAAEKVSPAKTSKAEVQNE